MCVGSDSVVQGSRGVAPLRLHVLCGYLECRLHPCGALPAKVGAHSDIVALVVLFFH